MIRRGGGQSGSRYVDLTELEREMDLSNARVVALYRDPRAVITSQINQANAEEAEEVNMLEELIRMLENLLEQADVKQADASTLGA